MKHEHKYKNESCTDCPKQNIKECCGKCKGYRGLGYTKQICGNSTCFCHTQAPQKRIKDVLTKIMNNPRTFDEPNAEAPQEEKKFCCSFGNYPSVVHTMDCPNFVDQKKDGWKINGFTDKLFGEPVEENLLGNEDQKKDTSLVDNELTITKDTSWDVELKEKWTKWCRDKENFDLDYYSEEMLNWWEQEIQKARVEGYKDGLYEKEQEFIAHFKAGRQQTISSVIEEIEKLESNLRFMNKEEEKAIYQTQGYNQALEDLKTLLKQKIN